MSTAWYKPNRLAKRVRSWTTSTAAVVAPSKSKMPVIRSVEVWETTCVVTRMPTTAKVLINPANPSLSGVSRFSYFPVGGPEPPKQFRIAKDSHPIMGYVTSWGGMEVGQGMAFASNTVDGIVHMYGGTELKRACEKALQRSWWNRITGTGSRGRVKEGEAVSTPAFGTDYDVLVHTVPPFFQQEYRTDDDTTTSCSSSSSSTQEHNELLLAECYRNSIKVASEVSTANVLKISCPLLGAGCRGFPIDTAIRIAAKASIQWMVTEKNEAAVTIDASREQSESSETIIIDDDEPSTVTLAFGIPDGDIRKQLIDAIEREAEKRKR